MGKKYTKSVKNWLFAILFAFSLGGSMFVATVPQTAYAASCSSGFMGFPAWYRGLTTDPPECNIKSPSELDTSMGGSGNGLSNFIWLIVLNCVEIAVVAVGYISGFYFLYGGFLFIISQGKPEGAAKARTTMINAVIGLVISMAAVALVNFIVDGVFIYK